MDIPVRFKFFDKLKLYQDYLKKDTMLEKTKSDYWLYEKAVMFWAYSPDHQHLGIDLSVDTLKKRAEAIVKIARKIGHHNTRPITWVEKYRSRDETIEKVIGNLLTLQLIDKCGDDRQKFTVNLKGFLLGELLFETFNCPSILSKNFRKYKIVMLIFYILFSILVATALLVFSEKTLSLFGGGVMGSFFAGLKSAVFYDWWSVILTSIALYVTSRLVWSRL